LQDCRVGETANHYASTKMLCLLGSTHIF